MTPCREWQGPRNSAGYGNRYTDVEGQRERVYMHRWVVAQIHGWEAIKERVVMHLCDNPPCYRYDHLRIGTQGENIRDAVAKGRKGGATHCKWGHHKEGRMNCRTCNNQSSREYRKRKKDNQ